MRRLFVSAAVAFIVAVAPAAAMSLQATDPVTVDESNSPELRARFTYEAAALAFAETVRDMPGFDEVLFDPVTGGLVIGVIGGSKDIDAAVAAATLPGPAPTVRQMPVPAGFLDEARELLTSQLLKGGRLEWSVLAVDYLAGGLILAVSPEDVAAANAAVAEWEALSLVPITVQTGSPFEPLACTDRDHCTQPMKNGVRIRNGSVNGLLCSLGWIVSQSGARHFITAGHCAAYASPDWYHQGLGLLGGELATLFQNGGKDAMKVGFPDAQASTKIYGEQATVSSSANPTLNETVCSSLGVTNAIRCGTVNFSSANCIVDGLSTTCALASGISAAGGDSGSPFYKRVSSSIASARGVLSGEAVVNGVTYMAFARAGDITSGLGVSIP